MKILIDARLYGLENAGLGRYVMNLVSELSEIDDKNEYSILLRKKYFDELKLPQNFKKVLANFRHYSFSEQVKLPKMIVKEKPDIVHFPHFNVPVFYKGAFVVTIHDLLMHYQKGFEATTLTPPLYAIKRIGYRMVFDYAVKKSIKILVPSSYVKDELLSFYHIDPAKTVVTYEGVGKIHTSNNKTGVLSKYKIDGPYFIYAGNAYPHKNLKRAIEAVISLNTNKRVSFLIASARNNFTAKLNSVIDELGAKDRVRLLGFVPDSDLPALYKNSVAFLYPSLSEGFGLQGLEAMTAQTLVLASNIDVFKEIYKDNAIYFDPKKIDSIKNAMQAALNFGPKEREAKINQAVSFAKGYSWSKMAKETLKIYESCYRLRPGQ